MKPIIRLLILLLVFVSLGSPTLLAQNTTTQGKEFWVSFIGNGFKTRYDTWGSQQFTWLRIQLIVSAKRNCHCTVKNPNTGYERTFQVNANSTYLFDDIPWEEAYFELEEHGQILNKGLLVTADDTVSVYCSNIAEVSFDASYVLPAPALGDDYIIQTYDQSTSTNSYYGSYYTSTFLIVATEEGETTVDITPSVNTLDGHTAHEEYSITLHHGEAYQVRSNTGYGSRDLSGSRVTARDCKKIAVFNGNNLTMVPDGGADSDCIFEQAMPLTSWGKKFVVTASLGRQLNDIVKITSAHDNNQILKNGEVLTTLNAGESISFELRQSDISCFIEASSSCAVFLYNHSKDPDSFYQDGTGAPSMVWIAPIEQRINEITFSTFNYESEHDTDIDNHYVNIIVSSDDINNVYLDGTSLSPSDFQAVNGTTEYRFARVEIQHDSHHLTCSNGFNAHVYGFGHAKGYAYLVGSNASNLSTSVSVNDAQLQSGDSFAYCAEEAITFKADINYPNATVLWSFGDGTTSTDNPATHVYHERRAFEVSLFVETDAGGCAAGDSDSLVFHIDATQQYVIESDQACIGQPYSGYGFSNVNITGDTLLTRLIDNPIHPECKDSLLVYISAREQYHVPLTDMRCWTGQPAIYDDYGFSFEYDTPGIIERTLTLPTAGGCDSIVTMTLTVNAPITYEFDTIVCRTFLWDGIEYDHSGDFDRTYPNASNGCDSIVTCHLSMGGTVEGVTSIAESCDQYEWEGSTYTQTGTYSFVHATSLGCDSIVHLDLTIDLSPNPSEISPVDPENVYPHWVVTATEFQINSYEFHFWDINDACVWDSVSWEFETPDLLWLLEPDSTTNPAGTKCKIYVLNYVEDTVWLKATAYNDCKPQGVERRYWFVCSFYGIDDNETNSFDSLDLDVIPNPNNGTMHINMGDLEGRVNVSVYDMQGLAIDQFELTATPQSLVKYDLRGQKSGIFFFVFKYNGNVVTKKIVITR